LSELEAVESDRAAMRTHRDRTQARFEKQTRAAHGEALSALRAARREIEDVRKHVRAKAAEATPETVREATRKLVPPGAAVAQHEPRRKLPPGTPATAEQLVVGTPIIVPRLGRCEVAAAPTDGKVEVRLGSMRALVPIADVLLDSHRNARRHERERPPQDGDEKPQ